jgi:hypothetical protein
MCLIIFLLKTPDSYMAHLSGINKSQQLLPFALPYKPTNKPMFSEMSFKCRSTTSFPSSSYTLIDPASDPLYTLYPTLPEKAYGLGIYTPKKSISSSHLSPSVSTASFLTSRPSLKTLRSQASLAGSRPLHLHSKSYPTTSSAHSPLPPVPTYNPEKYKNFPPLRLHGKKSSSGPAPPPRRAYTLKRRGSQGTLHVVLRSPSCPMMLGNHHKEDTNHDKVVQVKKEENKPSNFIINEPLARTMSLGAESISSVYSRSLSGDDPEPTTNDTPRTTIPTATANSRNPRPYHHQTSSFNPRTSSMPSQHPLYARQPPFRPTSRPVSGPRPQSAARPPPIRYHQHHRQRHPGSNEDNNNNNRILVRNHFPGPGHNHQRNRKTASAEEVRTRSRSRSSRLPVARAVSGFGDVGGWSGVVAAYGHGRGNGIGNGSSDWAARCGLPPLPVDKARFREVWN